MEAHDLHQNNLEGIVDHSAGSIIDAWLQLAQSGTASRYLGQRSDGRHQVALTHPSTGVPVAMGTGLSVAEAIHAALREIPR